MPLMIPLKNHVGEMCQGGRKCEALNEIPKSMNYCFLNNLANSTDQSVSRILHLSNNLNLFLDCTCISEG